MGTRASNSGGNIHAISGTYVTYNENISGTLQWKYQRKKINGTTNGSSSNVFYNGKNAVLPNNSVSEYDTVSISNPYENLQGFHSSATGYIRGGNNHNVFVNGASATSIGASVDTHVSGYKTKVRTGASNVWIGSISDGGDTEGNIDWDGNGNPTPPVPSPPIIEVPPSDFVNNGLTRSWRDTVDLYGSARNWDWRDHSDGSRPEQTFYIYQGEWKELDNSASWGNHIGLIVFPQEVRDKARGQSINKIELYIARNDDQGYASRQNLYIYTHMYTNLFPKGLSDSALNDTTNHPTTGNSYDKPTISNSGGLFTGNDGNGWNRDEEKWGTLPSSYNTLLSNGQMTGVAFYWSGAVRTNYMHFNHEKLRLKVTFN